MTYRAGIIGTGGIAGMGILGMHDEDEIGQTKVRASHAGGYRETDDIDLVAVADVNEDALTTFGEAWDVPPAGRYIGHTSMLDNEDLDVVSICTPTVYHHEHVLDVVHSRADPDVIWCEKPIATSVRDAEAMVAACDEEGVELIINHSFRFTDKLRDLRALIQEEDILGNVQSVAAQYRMELMRNSTHLIDTLIYLLDARVVKASGHITGENEAIDTLNVSATIHDAGGGGYLVLADDTFVTIDCTLPRRISSMTYNLIGDKGKLYLNNDDGEWRYWQLEDDDHHEEFLAGLEEPWTWDTDYRQSFPNAATHIVDVLKGRAQNHSPGVDAIQSLETIVAFYISHYTDGSVSLPLADPLKDVTVNSW